MGHVQKYLRSTYLHTNQQGRRNVFSRGRGSGGFFQVVVKNMFPVRSTVVKFHFTISKLREAHFSTKKVIGKYQTSKSSGAGPSCNPFRRPCKRGKYYWQIRQPTLVLPQKLGLCNRIQKFRFRLRLHHLNIFSSGSSCHHSKLFGLGMHAWPNMRMA